MASYMIVNPPDANGKDERAIIVRDGFSFFGLLLPLVFLLWHRLWLASAIFIVLALATSILSEVSGLVILPSIFWVVSSLFVALEGKYLRVTTLVARGWKVVAIVSAGSFGEAEAIYFAEDAAGEKTGQARPMVAWKPADMTKGANIGAGPAIGLVNPFGDRRS